MIIVESREFIQYGYPWEGHLGVMGGKVFVAYP